LRRVSLAATRFEIDLSVNQQRYSASQTLIWLDDL
jgi:hypothetical protein